MRRSAGKVWIKDGKLIVSGYPSLKEKLRPSTHKFITYPLDEKALRSLDASSITYRDPIIRSPLGRRVELGSYSAIVH